MTNDNVPYEHCSNEYNFDQKGHQGRDNIEKKQIFNQETATKIF